MALEIWDPFNNVRGFDSLFNRLARPRPVWAHAPGQAAQWPIPVDVVENGDALNVTATLPGVTPDDLEVVIEDGILTIKASANEEAESENGRFLVRERRTGAFRRAIRLPDEVDADKAESSYTDGLLRISLPKPEAKKPKQVRVKVG